jgi:hypothetical protein
MSTLTFPFTTQLKNILDPSVASDAATANYVQNYVTSALAGTSAGNANIAGSNTQVFFNNANSNTLGASANFTFTNTSNTLTVDNINSINMTVSGNLTVSGSTTYVNSTIVDIKDSIIQLGTGTNGAALTSNTGIDIGTALNYFTTTPVVAFMGWKDSAQEFIFASNSSIANSNVSINNYGNIHAGNANLGNAVSANYILGNGYYLTGISSGSANPNALVSGNSNIKVDSNSFIQMSANGVANVLTLTDISTNVAGNLNVSGVSNLGPISNVVITGGSANSILITDGSGDLSWGQASTLYSNTFTGTGTQTLFGPLPVTPSSINQTFVNYNGVLQLRSSYTLSGANISFSAPPAYGAVIEVTLVGVTAVVASTNSSNATTISNGNSNVVVNAGGSTVISANAVYGVATFLDTGSNITSDLGLANVNVSGNANLGSVSNVKISGGTSGQFLSTDGSGNLSWATGGTGGSSSTLYSDVFTGTGTQTMFGPLSASPNSVNQTWINYNGVLQLRSSYTLSGANIVFTAPPAYGSSIEITTITAGSVNVSTSQITRSMVMGILFGG